MLAMGFGTITPITLLTSKFFKSIYLKDAISRNINKIYNIAMM